MLPVCRECLHLSLCQSNEKNGCCRIPRLAYIATKTAPARFDFQCFLARVCPILCPVSLSTAFSTASSEGWT